MSANQKTVYDRAFVWMFTIAIKKAAPQRDNVLLDSVYAVFVCRFNNCFVYIFAVKTRPSTLDALFNCIFMIVFFSSYLIRSIASVVSSCNQDIKNNITYFISPNFPTLTSSNMKICKLKIKMMSSDISQLRFDFVHFSIVSDDNWFVLVLLLLGWMKMKRRMDSTNSISIRSYFLSLCTQQQTNKQKGSTESSKRKLRWRCVFVIRWCFGRFPTMWL